jgi:hypothetical protein
MHRTPIRTRLSWLAGVLAMATMESALASAAGLVDFAVGDAQATGADGQARVLAKGGEINAGDRILTNQGRVQIRFSDGAYVSLQPNTTFEVRQYRFSGKTDGSEKGVFGLLRGALRTVTGLIGHVNRDAYQIQTPTATIGIRGTGGIIEVLADGTTRITGTSGIWLLQNTRDSLEVPAGTVGEAGPNQNEPPKETTEQPVLPPPQPIQVAGVDTLPPAAGPATYVAGNQVPMAPNCSGGCELAYAIQQNGFGGVGALPATDPVGLTQGPPGQLLSFTVDGQAMTLTGTTVEFGAADGIVAWGRWVGSATINGQPWTGFQSLPYVFGLPTPMSDLTASSATFTYHLIGATAPTDGTNVGIVTGGTLVGAFGPTPKVGIDLSLSIAGQAYNINSGGATIPVSGAGPYAPFSASGVGTTSSTGGCAVAPCSTQVVGHFMGPGATHAGFTYSVFPYPGPTIVGAAAFKR